MLLLLIRYCCYLKDRDQKKIETSMVFLMAEVLHLYHNYEIHTLTSSCEGNWTSWIVNNPLLFLSSKWCPPCQELCFSFYHKVPFLSVRLRRRKFSARRFTQGIWKYDRLNMSHWSLAVLFVNHNSAEKLI